MYHERMLEVAKIENGFLIEIRGTWKIKDDADEAAKDKCCCVSRERGYGEKELYAKDAAELGRLITDLMPLLEEEHESEEAFDAAFSKAAGMK